jgi:hypothetical protein
MIKSLPSFGNYKRGLSVDGNQTSKPEGVLVKKKRNASNHSRRILNAPARNASSGGHNSEMNVIDDFSHVPKIAGSASRGNYNRSSSDMKPKIPIPSYKKPSIFSNNKLTA